MRVFGLEEHFVTTNVIDAWSTLAPEWQDLAQKASSSGESGRRLSEIGEERFKAMEEAGVDVQVLSLTAPGLQNLSPAVAVPLQVETNDLLASAIRSHPDRLQGLATLATAAPDAAALELERSVTKLGLNGVMLFGRTRERNIDHPDFWPVFEAASALRAPIYLHPQSPLPVVRAAYYDGLGQGVDAAFATHRIGWHYETGIQLLRLIASGVLDRFPDLQLIVGHWGELVLFYLERLEPLADMAKLKRSLSEYIRSNVFVTPSGMFSHNYLRWAVETVGVDRILFSTDYPFERGGSRSFLEKIELSETDREKITFGNWERLCSDIRR
ncbi:amidohydrolase family protein [Bacillus sp. BRMEA1]|uniref:amidohydrolase family protein n=1 Tax=Neobacillus endophyticus TaxID=2738405 RepID=UPI00156647F3|nr:amidohydrolase family protein [Neobacillus endophyticus]NRD80893.1 amidohydrolase family protein [Neobacillus endophyticus]